MSRTLNKNTSVAASKDDPYIINQGILSQLDRQLNTESLFQQITREREQALFQFESDIVDRLKQTIIGVLQWDGEHCAETSARLTDIRRPISEISEQDDQTAFIQNRRGSLFDPTSSPLANDQVYYKNRDSAHVQPIRQGMLMYKMGDDDTWKRGQLVITAIGYLHCFPASVATNKYSDSDLLYSLRLDQCLVGQHGMSQKGPFSWTVAENERGGFFHRHSIGGVGGGSSGGGGSASTNRIVCFRADNEPLMIDWWNVMSRISHKESPLTIPPVNHNEHASATNGTASAQSAPPPAPPSSSLSPSRQQQAQQQQQHPVVTPTKDAMSGVRTEAPYKESPTLPEDSPFIAPPNKGRTASTPSDVGASTGSSLTTPTKVMEGPVVRYPNRVIAQPSTTSSAGVPISLASDSPSSPSPFGVSDENPLAAPVIDHHLTSVPNRSLSQLAAIDPDFPNYTRGLTFTQKQHVGDVLVSQGQSAAISSACSFGIGVFAANAGKRRLVNHETTKDAAMHASLDLIQGMETFGWDELPFFDSLEIPYGTLDAMTHKLAMRNTALLGHLHKHRRSKPDMLAKQRSAAKRVSIPADIIEDEAPYQDPLPFYDVDLQKEQPWGTLGSIRRPHQALRATTKDSMPRKETSARRHELKGMSDQMINKQLAEEYRLAMWI
ncbi:hypothetical protein BDF22DRAFT_114564 [Syncephalis plumigaleata]|nr:hypothetical protein BDF22DRAFT_114564 [Syncephalis plumigaleata]